MKELKHLHENFGKYEELSDAYMELLVNIDSFASALPKKFLNSLLSDVTKNYTTTMKQISYNESFKTRYELKEQKLLRKGIKLEYKALKIKSKAANKKVKYNNWQIKKECSRDYRAFKKTFKTPFSTKFKKLFSKKLSLGANEISNLK